MRTPYDKDNQAFSDDAHQVAQKEIYPHLFTSMTRQRDFPLMFESTTLAMGERERLLDAEMSVDRIVKVKGRRSSLQFTVQERFRRTGYVQQQDVTVTAWNGRSNTPSELYKMDSAFFVYGYFDSRRLTFIDWIVFHTSIFKCAVIDGRLSLGREIANKKGQIFHGIPFANLRRVPGLVAKERADIDGIKVDF